MPGYELIGVEERQAMLEWFDASQGVLFAHGFDGMRRGVFKVREFERAVAEKVGARYAQAVSSGSAALSVALRALGVGPGDEVITQSFTFVATVEAILQVGATPVITEIDESLTMDPVDLESRITAKTKVIIPVHMAGTAADMDRILRIAKAKGLMVLEDAAQAFGGTYQGRALGTLGDMGVYSFDFAKSITTGEGGMIVTNQQALYERSRAYHDHGHDYNPRYPRGKDTRQLEGFNFRITEVQAVFGLAQLKKIAFILEKQRAHKARLKAGLEDGSVTFQRLHNPDGETADTLIFFLSSASQAQHLAEQLVRAGFSTKNLPDAFDWHFAGTWQHLFRDIPALANPQKRWPQSTALLHRAIALPVRVKMSEEEITKTIDVIRASLSEAHAPLSSTKQ